MWRNCELTRCCCRLYEIVKQINKLEAGMRVLSDDQLQVRKQFSAEVACSMAEAVA